MFAGADATRTVLSSLFYYLLSNKEKLDKLREEVNRFYPRGKKISSEHFREMSYLDACLNEALRLSPPFPSGPPRDAGLNPGLSRGRTLGQ
jgi:cytochrome P450